MKLKFTKKGKMWFAGLPMLFIAIIVGMFSASAEKNNTVPSCLVKGTEVPEEVLNLVDAYLKDTLGPMSFNKIRNHFRIDPAINLSELKAGVPVHFYSLYWNKFMSVADAVPLSTVLNPGNAWLISIHARGKYLYYLDIRKTPGLNFYHLSGLEYGDRFNFESPRTCWPESSGYIPIYIDCSGGEFLHFPQIDDYNLISLDGRYPYSDSVAALDKANWRNLNM